MVEINIAYQGRLRCSAVHEPSGVELITDAPKDNHGEGASFSPTDLVGTALGSCMLTIMAMAAEKEQLDLTGTTVKVSKEMVSQPLRRIGKLSVEVHVPMAVSAAVRQKLQNAALSCPVHRSLHPDVQIPINFVWAGDVVPSR